MTPRTVHIILIRHCETEENVKAHHLNEAFQRIRELKFPTVEQIFSTLSLLQLDIDSPSTECGKRQIEDMSLTLNDTGFWDNFEFDICAFSPLQRTKETCFGIIPSKYHEKCIALDCLKEIEPWENLFPSTLTQKFEELEKWIQQQQKEQIIIVGHSRYFGKLLKSKTLMRNCDVWQTAYIFDSDESTNGKANGYWKDLTLLFRSPLAVPHPVDGIFSWSGNLKNSSNSSPEVDSRPTQTHKSNSSNNNLEEAICRICQVSFFFSIFHHIISLLKTLLNKMINRQNNQKVQLLK
jgi:broad specificity phosphatase PhoE